MNKWNVATRHFMRSETAVSSMEYAVVASLIAVVCAATVGIVGMDVDAFYTNVCHQVSIAISGAPAC